MWETYSVWETEASVWETEAKIDRHNHSLSRGAPQEDPGLPIVDHPPWVTLFQGR